MLQKKEVIELLNRYSQSIGHGEEVITESQFDYVADKICQLDLLVSQKNADLDFGDYCLIEQNRFGADNEMYLHKVIGQLESNSYVDVPVTGTARETLHDKSAKVIRAITCGVEEKIALKYRIEDVKIDSRFSG